MVRTSRLRVVALVCLLLAALFVPLARPAAATTFTGSVSKGGAAKIFNITATNGNAISADLTWPSTTADLNLSLKNPSGAVVSHGFSTPKNAPEKIVYKALATGTYKLVVVAKIGSSSFTLTASVDPGLPASISDSRSGSVSKTGVVSLQHEFSVPAPGQISISVGWPTTSANLNLQLKDPSGATKASTSSTTANPETVNFNATTIGPWKLQVTAASGGSAYTANISVSMGNSAPVANDDAAKTIINTTNASIAVLGNDTDPNGDSLHVGSVTQGSNGATVAINPNSTVSYTPATGFTGIDTFTYGACDNAAPSLCDTATVTVTVRGTNAAPDAIDDTTTATSGVDKVVLVLANDTDPDGDLLHLGNLGTSGHGTVTGNGDGSVTYKPDAAFVGTDSFTYEACDNWTTPACDTATVTVTVTAAPTGTDFQGYYYWSGGPVSATMKTHMADPLVDGLSVVKKWKDVETSYGVYDWSVFDAWVNAATQVGKPLLIRSYVGITADSPQWLYTTHGGMPGVTKFVDGSKYLPEFWDPTFQRDFTQFINEMSAKYGNNPKLIIEVFGPWDPFAEPFMPCLSSAEQDTWTNDYRTFSGNSSATFGTVQTAFQDFEINYLFPTFATAFTKQPLAHATGRLMCDNPSTHPFLKQIYDTARTRYGGYSTGVGAQGFFPQNNGLKGTDPYPISAWISQNYNPVDGTSSKGGIGYQVVGCVALFCSNGVTMTADEFVKTIDNAAAYHGSYIEIQREVLEAAENPNQYPAGSAERDAATKIRNVLLADRSSLSSTLP